MKKVLIAGGSGLIGSYLKKGLTDKDYKVNILSRSKNQDKSKDIFSWDPGSGYIDLAAFENVDSIINLAGSNIGQKRWTKSRKRNILESRILSTNLLYSSAKKLGLQDIAFISASAIGYYGVSAANKVFTENDGPSDNFVGTVCRIWEEEADKFSDISARVVKLRLGIVLDKRDGALARIMKPVRLGIGSAIGSGKQYLPWIHPADLTSIIIKSIEDKSLNGPYNVVAPHHISNLEFTRVLAKELDKPFNRFKVPAFLIKMAFGKMSEIVLEGSMVSPDKILSTGFNFQYPRLDEALNQILN